MKPDRVERPLQTADEQAEAFERVRQAHLMEAIEDYVELIDDLISNQGEARLVDVAERLGITQPSASKTLARLQRDGYITSEPYRSIFLTTKGKALADKSRARHDIVFRFLLAIGVGEETAKQDSEGLEHHVSDETLAAFERVINNNK
jgi:DtxR family manganese transport transcriptional regulator